MFGWGVLSQIIGGPDPSVLLPMPASLLTGMYQEWKVVQHDGKEVVQRENKTARLAAKLHDATVHTCGGSPDVFPL